MRSLRRIFPDPSIVSTVGWKGVQWETSQAEPPNAPIVVAFDNEGQFELPQSANRESVRRQLVLRLLPRFVKHLAERLRLDRPVLSPEFLLKISAAVVRQADQCTPYDNASRGLRKSIALRPATQPVIHGVAIVCGHPPSLPVRIVVSPGYVASKSQSFGSCEAAADARGLRPPATRDQNAG